MNVQDFIKNFDVLLFDMGKTFMFESDRFGIGHDYGETYRSLGGGSLTGAELHDIMNHIYGTLLTRGRNEKYFDEMLRVDELIERDSFFRRFESEDKSLIERVFANHECGVVPESCRKTLEILSKTHKLGVISNVWCKSSYFRDQLKNDGVYDLFDIVIFSSDHASVKPSRKLFNLAALHFNKAASEIVFIGDNYNRDVIGSKNAGMKSILVNNSSAGTVSGVIQPDFIIDKIEDLVN